MTVLDIKIIPDPVLRSPTSEIGTFDARLHQFLNDMYETMLASNGLGLAAPQVGVSEKVVTIDLTVDAIDYPAIEPAPGHTAEDHIFSNRLELINPVITEGGRLVSSEEGCLSIPEYRDSIKRHETISAEAHDRFGRRFAFRAEKLLAFCVQHEVDHLNGVLFTDHLSRLKKQLFLRWCNKHDLQAS